MQFDHRRIEAAGRAMLEDLHAAQDEETRAGLGLSLHRVGGAIVSVCRSDPSILLNRVAGLGVDRPATATELAEIRRLFDGAGIGRFFLHLAPGAAPRELRELIESHGLRPARGWMKFVRSPGPAPVADCDLAVREIDRRHADAFGAIAAFGFDLRQESGRVLANLVGRPEWRVFMAFDGDRPAACGALFSHQGMAWTDFGATHPDFRRRGAQSALLAARVRAAGQAGRDLIATETGEAVPGDPQHSYGNILKSGFEEAYLRENWAPAA